jgi:hypothetical protein
MMNPTSVPENHILPSGFNRFNRVMILPGFLLFIITGYISLTTPLQPDATDPGYPLWVRIAGALVVGPTSIILGWFVSRRVKDNPIGPVLVHWGCATNAQLGVSHLPPFWGALSLYYLMVIVLPGINLMLAFLPTGRGMTARWDRMIKGWILGLMGCGFLANFSSPTAYGLTSSSPLAVARLIPFYPTVIGIYTYYLNFSFFLAICLILYRYRTTHQTERKQMRWLLMIGLYFLLWLGVGYFIINFLDAELSGLGGLVTRVMTLLAFAVPSVAISIALLRYRLWDIDLIIRRTLIYGLLSGALVLIYFGGVTLLQQLFTGLSGQQSPASIVISTLGIAALFNPLHRWVQRFIDRRFYRPKYDAARSLAEFSVVVRNEVELNALTNSLATVVTLAVEPQSLSLWIKASAPKSPLGDPRENDHPISVLNRKESPGKSR